MEEKGRRRLRRRGKGKKTKLANGHFVQSLACFAALRVLSSKHSKASETNAVFDAFKHVHRGEKDYKASPAAIIARRSLAFFSKKKKKRRRTAADGDDGDTIRI